MPTLIRRGQATTSPSALDGARPNGHRVPHWPRSGPERLGVAALGLIAGLDGVGYSVAVASLMFTGRLASGLGVAAGSALLCTAVIAVVVGIRSLVPTNIAHVQDVAVAILAALFARSDFSVGTAFVIVGAASLATGLVMWLTGRFHLGRIVKYFPQAVLAGFLAGTGWLLVRGGVAVAIGFAPTAHDLISLSGASARKLAPAVAMAVGLYLVMSKRSHPLVLLSVLASGLGAFYVWMWSSSTSHGVAVDRGLLPPRPSGAALQVPFPSLLDEVNWADVARSTPVIVAISLLCLFAMLMNTAALERTSGLDVDMDAELRTTGFGNLAVALVGAPPGYSGLGISVLGDKAGVRSRGAGVLCGLVVLVGFFFAGPIVSHVPTFLSAAFLIFLGAEMLADWVVRSLRSYSKTESVTVLVILGFVIFFGFLEATIAGFVVATLLFAFSYARVPIVRSTASLATIASTRERPEPEMDFLRTNGGSVEVVRLHGYLFFGSTERVVSHVRERVALHQQPLSAVLLDMALVPGIDAASAVAIERIRTIGVTHGFRTAICGAAPAVQGQLARSGITLVDQDGAARPSGSTRAFDAGGDQLWQFSGIDLALQAFEEHLLQQGHIRAAKRSVASMLPPDVARAEFDTLLSAMRRTEHDAGEVILRSGEAGDELLLIERGRVAVVRHAPNGKPVQLREMGEGSFVGDIGFSLGLARTADIVAAEASSVLRINHHEVARLDPAQVALVHRLVARALAEKVVVANRMTDHAKSAE